MSESIKKLKVHFIFEKGLLDKKHFILGVDYKKTFLNLFDCEKNNVLIFQVALRLPILSHVTSRQLHFAELPDGNLVHIFRCFSNTIRSTTSS